MPLRVGVLVPAHLHVWGYVAALRERDDAELVGVYDYDRARGEAFAERAGAPLFAEADELLENVDAAILVSENTLHAKFAIAAARAGRHILCEKPLVTNEEDAEAMRAAVERSGVRFMTAFPCRYSPAYQALRERVRAGEIGAVRAIAATNRGRCPFGWFVDQELSGGGAMIDHVVHVADLLRDLLGADPTSVQAQIGSNMYAQEWDDTAMLTLDFPGGEFATLDSSWSRPASFKTWGDVTMNVVGDEGVIEADLFGQAVDLFAPGEPSHTVAAYGTNLDALMVEAFVRACLDGAPISTGLEDGLQAARIAIAGYRSAREGGPVELTAAPVAK